MIQMIDLNADIGEANTPQWAANEAAILSYVSSVNIACGGHAGNMDSMRETSRRAQDKSVNIGAHPSYPDRKNFGRRALILGEDITPERLSESLYAQICRLMDASKASVKYVKPHGALYNQAAQSLALADLIGDVILRVDPMLTWLGAPKSDMQKSAQARNISYAAEAFIDRQYNEDGQLIPRAQEGAVLTDDTARIGQALSLAKDSCVISRSGKRVPLSARSLCVHGDTDGALNTARLTRTALEADGFNIGGFI